MSLSLNTEVRDLLNGRESTPESTATGKAGRPSVKQPGPDRSPLLWAWFVLACLLAVGVLFLIFRRHAAAPTRPTKTGAAPPAVQVSTAVVRKGDIGIYVNALGMVTPVYTVQVKSRVDGQLVAVNYVEGQTVHAGDSLVEIRWGEGRGEGQLDLQRCMVNGWL